MLAALVTLTDKVVLALIDDPVIPDSPDGCEYLILNQGVYDNLNAEIINKYRCLKWRLVDDGAGSFFEVENLQDRVFYAIYNTGDRAIVALDTALPDFTRAGTEVIEIPQADYLLMAAQKTTHDAEGLVPAWDVATDGTVTTRPDIRPVLRVTQPNPAVTGTPVVINFSWEDSSGSQIPVNEGRDILLRSVGVPESIVRINLIGGIKSVQKSLEAGLHELVTPDSASYRITGDTIIEVAEVWT